MPSILISFRKCRNWNYCIQWMGGWLGTVCPGVSIKRVGKLPVGNLKTITNWTKSSQFFIIIKHQKFYKCYGSNTSPSPRTCRFHHKPPPLPLDETDYQEPGTCLSVLHICSFNNFSNKLKFVVGKILILFSFQMRESWEPKRVVNVPTIAQLESDRKLRPEPRNHAPEPMLLVPKPHGLP